MNKKSASQSAFWDLRVSISLAFCLLGLVLALLAFGFPPRERAMAQLLNETELPMEKDSPPDTTPYTRPAIPEDYAPGGHPSLPLLELPSAFTTVVRDVVVSNTDPNLTNTDTFNDGEPSIAIDPTNTNQIVISAFSGSWGSNAPMWHSANGGTTWTKRFTVPIPPGVPDANGCPCDQAFDYDRSNRVSGTFLSHVDIYSGTSTNPTLSSAWNWLLDGTGTARRTNAVTTNSIDQPWLLVNRDPTTSSQDNVYVAYDEFGSNSMRVAVSLGTNPPNFVRDNLSGMTGGGIINPGHRLAVDPTSGAVYSLWQVRAGTGAAGTHNISYRLNRSTDGGQTWTLNGSGSGIQVATADSTQACPSGCGTGCTNNTFKFGTVNTLLGGVLHAAVDPTNGSVFYVYGNRDSATNNNRLAIRHLTNNGTGGLTVGAQVFVTGQVQAALPSVAVSSDGTVGVLYTQFDGLSSTSIPMFSVHLAVSTDHGQTFSNDLVLENFLSSATDNGDCRQRVLGDYQQVKAVGTTFYGTFTANGVPFGRPFANHDPIFFKVSPPTTATHTLTVNSSNPNSGVSITVSPNDNNGAGNGTTQFTRIYNSNVTVSLTAPSSASGNNFQKWQRDGVDWATSTSTTVTMDTNHTMTAMYGITTPTPTPTAAPGCNPATFVGTGVGPIPDGFSGTPPVYGTPLVISFVVSGRTAPLTAVSVDLTLTHSFVGDLDIVLTSPGGAAGLATVSRIGVTTAGSFGDSSNYAGRYNFTDATAGTNIWTVGTAAACGDTCDLTAGDYRTTAPGATGQSNPPPVTSLNTTFASLTTGQINGTWTLTVRDAAAVDTGSVTLANLKLSQACSTPTPTPPPSPTATVTPTATPCAGMVFSEKFDGVIAPALPGGWIATNFGGDGTAWVTSVTASDTAPNDVYIPDQNGVSDKRLDTPSIAINSTSARLIFRNNFNTEVSGGIYWDGGVLEISSPNINGGAFTDILAAGGSFVSGGYTGIIDNTASNPLAGRLAWSGDSGGYITTVVNLGPNVSGQTIKLRFRMGTDLFTVAPGWRIDTVSVTDGPCTTQIQFGNIATRMRVDTGNSVMIGGFIITGNAPKNVVVRGIGPSLASFGVTGVLADPTLELRAANGSLIAQNDNWQDTPSQAAQINALGFALQDPRESGIFATLQPGAYTAILAGKNGGSGVGLVEMYDTNQAVDAQLANISTRGFVLTGTNVMIGGFILGGSATSTRVVVRGIGPSLAQFGLSPVLADPTVELHDGNGAILLANDNWQDNAAQAAELVSAGLAPTNSLESGLIMTLPPGQFTAILAGKNNGTGIGLIEVYNIH